MDVTVYDTSDILQNNGKRKKYAKNIERDIKAVQMVIATIITVCISHHFLYSLPLQSNRAAFLQLLFLIEATAAVYFGIRTIWYGTLCLLIDD